MKNTESNFQKSSRYEIRIAGSGGQGVVLAGVVLAEAALLEGKHVAQSQSYGPETRGGSSTSEVVLSDAEIDYPKAVEPDLLVALTQQACNSSLPGVKEDGLVIVNSDQIKGVLWGKAVSLPFSQIAQKAGEIRAINMATLGAVAAFCPGVSRDSLAEVIAKRLPPAKVAANLLALDEALKRAQTVKKELRTTKTREELEI